MMFQILAESNSGPKSTDIGLAVDNAPVMPLILRPDLTYTEGTTSKPHVSIIGGTTNRLFKPFGTVYFKDMVFTTSQACGEIYNTNNLNVSLINCKSTSSAFTAGTVYNSSNSPYTVENINVYVKDCTFGEQFWGGTYSYR